MSILTLLVVVGLIYLVIRLQIFLLKILVGLVLLGMLASGGAFGQTTTVRDSTGRVIQTQDYRHTQTTVRDQNGRTVEAWQYQSGEKIVRDRYGRTIRTER